MSGRKRKAAAALYDPDEEYNRLVALGSSSSAPAAPTPAKRARKSTAGASGSSPEKRLARVRNSCPQNIMERVHRVMTQRFYMVERRRSGEESREEFKVLGSTGNVYTVVIDKLPSCDCPDACKGNHCKHILFIMLKVLCLPQSSNLYYQKALLSSELAAIFDAAPSAPTSATSDRLRAAYEQVTGKAPKATIEDEAPASQGRIEEGDDCAICYEAMDAKKLNLLTFCDLCHKPVHKDCFSQWARTGRTLTCVYCRAPWTSATGGASGSGSSSRATISEGYLNLAGAAGVSGVRDTSTYYHGPRRGYRSYGYGSSYGYSFGDEYY
ncbi:hypothetical protein AURDEDRAFT_106240 [Auricularia subglabra TFB-10046 SS5]|nr:hypothetical protein AURDEDRAFT_106240 [Auricularia subglabra TFB-10046 SS5]